MKKTKYQPIKFDDGSIIYIEAEYFTEIDDQSISIKNASEQYEETGIADAYKYIKDKFIKIIKEPENIILNPAIYFAKKTYSKIQEMDNKPNRFQIEYNYKFAIKNGEIITILGLGAEQETSMKITMEWKEKD